MITSKNFTPMIAAERIGDLKDDNRYLKALRMLETLKGYKYSIRTPRLHMKAGDIVFEKDLEPIKPICTKQITLDAIHNKWWWAKEWQKICRDKLIDRGLGWMGRGDLIGTFEEFCLQARAAGWAIV